MPREAKIIPGISYRTVPPIRLGGVGIALTFAAFLLLFYTALLPLLREASVFFLLLGTAGLAISAGFVKVALDTRVSHGEMKRIFSVTVWTLLFVFVAQLIFAWLSPEGLSELGLQAIPFALAFGGAIMEELFFRLGLLNYQLRLIPATPAYIFGAAVANSLIFTLFHGVAMSYLFGMWNPFYLLAIFGSSIVICLAVIHARYVEVGMGAHALFNLFVSAAALWGYTPFIPLLIGAGEFIHGLYYAFALAIMVVLFKILWDRYRSSKTLWANFLTVVVFLALLPLAVWLSPWLLVVPLSALLLEAYSYFKGAWGTPKTEPETEPETKVTPVTEKPRVYDLDIIRRLLFPRDTQTSFEPLRIGITLKNLPPEEEEARIKSEESARTPRKPEEGKILEAEKASEAKEE
jgi:membrane protease YdiL (CAAX protease family)